MSRFSSFVLPLAVLVALAACSAPKEEPSSGGAQIALTHSWNVPAETSRFYAVDMGTDPPEAADALMGKMPTVMHKIATACAEDQWGGKGELAISLRIQGGAPQQVAVGPELPVGPCLVRAVEAEAALFEGLPDTAVLIRANYMVSGGA